MVTKYGMSDRVGKVFIDDDSNISPAMAQVIDEEVKKLLDVRRVHVAACSLTHLASGALSDCAGSSEAESIAAGAIGSGAVEV